MLHLYYFDLMQKLFSNEETSLYSTSLAEATEQVQGRSKSQVLVCLSLKARCFPPCYQVDFFNGTYIEYRKLDSVVCVCVFYTQVGLISQVY